MNEHFLLWCSTGRGDEGLSARCDGHFPRQNGARDKTVYELFLIPWLILLRSWCFRFLLADDLARSAPL